ncbi:hypothetical protein J2R96_005849 [Bradyrhizobium elkanii]|nr:hypothetical protein [Bradyrhizobium elkanii]
MNFKWERHLSRSRSDRTADWTSRYEYRKIDTLWNRRAPSRSDEFVDRTDIDPRYLIRPCYLRPDGKVGHDDFAVIRETIQEMDKVAIGRPVLTNREPIIVLEAEAPQKRRTQLLRPNA